MSIAAPTRSRCAALFVLGTTVLISLTGPIHADQVFTENVNVGSKLCIGFACTDGVAFETPTQILLKAGDIDIRVEDTSTSSGFPTTDCSIQANQTSGPSSEHFAIRNISDATTPFFIDDTAPTKVLYLGEFGQVRMGTGAPEQLLHIRSNTANTDAFALFDANAAGSDAAFLLRQNGTVPTTWKFRNQQGSGRLKVGIAGGNTPFKIDGAAANNLLKPGINSNPSAVVVTGQLLVNNTRMNVPDYVFEEGYALRPLTEVATFIAEHGHLPGVPSAKRVADRSLDMTQMQMAQLEKIEDLTLHSIDQDAHTAKLEALIKMLVAERWARGNEKRAAQTDPCNAVFEKASL